MLTLHELRRFKVFVGNRIENFGFIYELGTFYREIL